MTTYKRCQNCHELFTEPRCPRCSRKYALERQRKERDAEAVQLPAMD